MARLRVVVVARTGQANVTKGGRAQNVIRLEKGPMPLTEAAERYSSGALVTVRQSAWHVNNGAVPDSLRPEGLPAGRHHQMGRLTNEKSRPSEPGRRVIGVTRWKGPGASQCVERDRSSPSKSHPSGCYIAIISPVTRAGFWSYLNEPGKCSACRALAPPSVGWGFFCVP